VFYQRQIHAGRLRPYFDVYKAVSLQIRAIFAEYTPMIEALSLDEAYLDVTDNLKGMEIATEIAAEIRAAGPTRQREFPTTSSWPKWRRTRTSRMANSSLRRRTAPPS